MPRSAYGHGRFLSVERIKKIAASFLVCRRSDGDTDGRPHGPHERRRALVACCLALVGCMTLASARSAAALPAMRACMPAAQGRTHCNTVSALGAGGRPPPPPSPPLSMARLRFGLEGGRPNRVSSVRWNSVAPFLVWTAASHRALTLWNGPNSLSQGRLGKPGGNFAPNRVFFFRCAAP
eukprot:364815-Chlamydomonas_euryale.AAC.3